MAIKASKSQAVESDVECNWSERANNILNLINKKIKEENIEMSDEEDFDDNQEIDWEKIHTGIDQMIQSHSSDEEQAVEIKKEH